MKSSRHLPLGPRILLQQKGDELFAAGIDLEA
jgi:hypothetical protein